MKFRSTVALAALLAATTMACAEPTAKGFWESRDKDGNPTAWFLFTGKEDVYSARLVKGFKPKGDDTPVKEICEACPGKKKGAHIMGLTLFWGMKRDGLEYSDGSVLDPRDGSVYHAKMWFDPDSDGSVLHVRGYLGISMFGQTQDWYRLPDDAMKKDEIPREILAGDEEKHKAHEAADKSAKAHDATAEKTDKPAKGHDATAEKTDRPAKAHEASAEKTDKPVKAHKKDKAKPVEPEKADADASAPAQQ